jgi:hypothetical protein
MHTPPRVETYIRRHPAVPITTQHEAARRCSRGHLKHCKIRLGVALAGGLFCVGMCDWRCVWFVWPAMTARISYTKCSLFYAPLLQPRS